MSSRPAFHAIGYNTNPESQLNDLPPPPPPPPRDVTFPGPLRRQNVHHPPFLTTAVVPVVFQDASHESTPLSTTGSYRSPFSLHSLSPAVVSANTPASASPMASRRSGNFGVPYDPRDWAPGSDTRTAQAQRVRENAAEDGLASPPPPYTPANIQQQSARSPRSPEMGIDRATSSVTQSPSLTANFTPSRPFPMAHTPPSNRHSIHMGSYMPPPPAGAPPISRARVVSDMQPSYDPSNLSSEIQGQPPAARRAASANAGLSRVPEAGPSRSASRQRNWVPGMPLPGPPPGPPPSTSRSQSTSSAYDRQGQPRPRNLRQTIHLSELGPVPPTPLTWTEGQPLPGENSNSLHIDTTNAIGGLHVNSGDSTTRNDTAYYSTMANTAPLNQAGSSSATGPPRHLSRSSAVRDTSAKGLLERRAQSRNSMVLNADTSTLSVQTNPWAEALQSSTEEARQDKPPLSGPRSARLMTKAHSPLSVVTNSHAQISASPVQLTSTPPISPSPSRQQQQPTQPSGSRSAGLPPKSLPTPPLSLNVPLSAHSVMQAHKDTSGSTNNNKRDSFEESAVRRHATFLEKERSASSDLERLQLFGEYILNEASIRQEKYKSAFTSQEFDVELIRKHLFKKSSHQSQISLPAEQAGVDETMPNTDSTPPQRRPETMWWKEYKPELSPIASMDYDEMSSRGRAPSRWWESSQTGSQSGGIGDRKLHRSKRESKYMGLSKEFLMAHSPSEEHSNLFNQTSLRIDPSAYPPEKANPDTFGYYEEQTPRRLPVVQSKKPETPALLDISRFITLPPPYPRHYPAVNNNHPDLAQYRTTVRTLSNLEEIQERKKRHQSNIDALRSDHKRKISDNRHMLKSSIQAQVANGTMTYAEAAESEEAYKRTEFEAEKKCLQAEFDAMQDSVINPLHDMLHDRISQLDVAIDQLQNDLRNDARNSDPDQPQEAGDEKPELLEKLTQLKWLFDVREQIHRECFDLLSQRNDKYKAIVLLPYRFTTNVEKVRNTESFFNKDAHTRYVAYCNDSSKRHEDFYQIIEQHVRRGVELQSSAFWDLAPGLLDLLQKIPEDLRHSQGILIPETEYKENPSYHEHPQQYLYSLLSHAEKSTYQFIEGQVNLQCLLHEVKTALVAARYRVLETSESGVSARNHELSDSRSQEEALLTAELKQKASMIEEQWLEAIGSQLQAKREAVKTLLQEDDAWDEIAAEDA